MEGAVAGAVAGAAGSSAVCALVAGPVRGARVVLATSLATYLALDLDDDALPGRPPVVAVLARQAVRVPVGILIPQDAVPQDQDAAVGGVTPGHAGPGAGWLVGGGEARLGSRAWRVGRWWNPEVPALGPWRPDGVGPTPLAHLTRLAARLPIGAELTRPGEAALAEALRRPDQAGLAAAVAGLVGLGDGLTPEGDDVLAGALVALAASDGGQGRARQVRRRLAAVVRERLDATTTVSAALLEQAALGRAIPELIDVLRWCASPQSASTGRPGQSGGDAVDRLLAVGHSSGAALARGMLLGLTETGEVPS